MSLNDNLNDDENFLKEFLKEFYRHIIKIENYSNFESILTEWMENFFDDNKKSPEIILKLMKDHEERENWLSSLIGFFYEYGFGYENIIDKNKSLELYSLSINKADENKKLTSLYQLLNIIVAEY